MRLLVCIITLLVSFSAQSQKTRVEGVVRDSTTGEVLPFVAVRFQDSKIGTYTDTAGHYILDTYYATDSLVFSMSGYRTLKFGVKKDASQEINIEMTFHYSDF